MFSEAKKNNIEIFSSPFDETAVDLLEELGCKAYKIASPEITHIPLITKVAKTGKPIIISTGLSKLKELANAIKVVRNSGNNKIIIFSRDEQKQEQMFNLVSATTQLEILLL